MIKTALQPDAPDVIRWEQEQKSWHLKFLRSPKTFISTDGRALSKVMFAVNRLEVSENDAIAISCIIKSSNDVYTIYLNDSKMFAWFD